MGRYVRHGRPIPRADGNDAESSDCSSLAPSCDVAEQCTAWVSVACRRHARASSPAHPALACGSLGKAFRLLHPQHYTCYNLSAAWLTLRACRTASWLLPMPKGCEGMRCVTGTPQAHPAPMPHLCYCVPRPGLSGLCSAVFIAALHITAVPHAASQRHQPPCTARWLWWLCRLFGRSVTADASLREPLTHFRV